MKRVLFVFSLVSLLVIVVAIYSCTKIIRDNMVGSWILSGVSSSYAFNSSGDSLITTSYDPVNSILKRKMSLKGSSMSITKDSFYYIMNMNVISNDSLDVTEKIGNPIPDSVNMVEYQGHWSHQYHPTYGSAIIFLSPRPYFVQTLGFSYEERIIKGKLLLTSRQDSLWFKPY